MNGIGLNDSLAAAAYNSQAGTVKNSVEVKSSTEIATQASSADKVTLSQEALKLSATLNESINGDPVVGTNNTGIEPPKEAPVAETNDTGIEPPNAAPFNTGIEPPKPK